MNLCFDFDGPIIDVSDRYYKAYVESLKESNIPKEQILSKEDYWKLKRNRISDLEIGILSGLGVRESKKAGELRKELAFVKEYHALDKIFNDAISTLNELKAKNILFFLVTLRQHNHLAYAIKHFKLEKYFNDENSFCIQDGHKIHNDIQDKHILLVNATNKLNLNPKDTWMIGDTDTDIHAARLAGYGKIIAISRGIRSKEQLELLKPDHLVTNLQEIISLIGK